MEYSNGTIDCKEWLSFKTVCLEASPDGHFVVIFALDERTFRLRTVSIRGGDGIHKKIENATTGRAGTSCRDSADHILKIHVQGDDGIQGDSHTPEDPCDLFHLGFGTRVTIEQDSGSAIPKLRNLVAHNAFKVHVGDEKTPLHITIGKDSQWSPGLDLGAKNITGAQMRKAMMLNKKLGLSSLARSRWAKEGHVHRTGGCVRGGRCIGHGFGTVHLSGNK
jgi:hypothetical protein